MKLLLKFLLTMLLISVSYTSCAEPITSSLKPEQGYYQLKSVPDEDLYRTFCQLEYETEEDISRERILGCKAALNEVNNRLFEIAMGRESNLIDLQFLKIINSALLHDDDLYHSGTKKYQVSFGILPRSDDAIRENINIAEDVYALTNVDFKMIFGCENIQSIEKKIKEIQEKLFLEWNSDQEKSYQGALACFEIYHNQKKILELTGVDRRVFRGAQESRWMKQIPVPLRLKAVDRLRANNSHIIFSLPIAAQIAFLNNLFENINTRLKNHTWQSRSSLDAEIVKVSRAILLVHAFHDGNTRTSRLILNMLRLSIGLAPFQSNLLPDFRDWSASEIVKLYYMNLTGSKQ